jgi:hypothetical protein
MRVRLSEILDVPNSMIDPATGRIRHAYTLLRRKGPNANIQRTRVSINTVQTPEHQTLGQGVGGVSSTQLGTKTTRSKAIGGL